MREIVIDQDGAALFKKTDGNANELNYDAKSTVPPDPIALRFGAWTPGYFAKISGDFLTGDPADPRRSERVYMAFRTDDHPDAAPCAGCIEFYIQRALVGQEDDPDEILVARLTLRAGLELFVPLRAYAGGELRGFAGVSGESGSRIVSPNGRFWFQPVQDDANGVFYDASNPANPIPYFDLVWLLNAMQALGHRYPNPFPKP